MKTAIVIQSLCFAIIIWQWRLIIGNIITTFKP